MWRLDATCRSACRAATPTMNCASSVGYGSRTRVAAFAFFGCLVLVQTVDAQVNPYHITEAERAACTPDAVRLCSSAYPDESKLLSCMTSHKKSLGENCAVIFEAGKKTRGLR